MYVYFLYICINYQSITMCAYIRMCTYILAYLCTYVYYIAGPGDIGRVNVTCSPVDVINQCIVTWNVSYMHTYVYCTLLLVYY